MTHGKKSKTIYTDLKYNRYMTDDRNRKSGNTISKFCIHDNCNKEAMTEINLGTLFPNFVFMIIVIKKLYIIFGEWNQNIVLIIKKITM